jgi:hypothetical protein
MEYFGVQVGFRNMLSSIEKMLFAKKIKLKIGRDLARLPLPDPGSSGKNLEELRG